MGQDPDAASAWLRKQPEDLRTDALYGETAEQLRRNNDYGQSVQWAEQIEDQDTRNRNLGRIYRDWKRDDEEESQRKTPTRPQVLLLLPRYPAGSACLS